MALADSETAGLNVAAAVTGELNALLEATDTGRVEAAILDARETLESAHGSGIVEAFETAEGHLAEATDAARDSDVEYELRQLRQAIVGLTESDQEGGA